MARDQRRLAAIVIADVVGYTRLMERDDSGTLARLRSIRTQLLEPKIEEYGGHVVRLVGDGMLLEFASADAALRCAIDVQRGMAETNRTLTSEERIEFRIGINIGDIILQDGDIAGDGVNVAARLETLAEAGGICVSAAVREQIHGGLEVGFVDISEQRVKNITRPVRVYRVVLHEGAEEKEPQAGQTTAARSSHYSPPLMSVAVMPFIPATDSADDKRFAERLTRDVTSAIERNVRCATVVSHGLATQYKDDRPVDPRAAGRDLNVRYLVEAELRNQDGSVVITAQLVETTSARQVWNVRLSAPTSAGGDGSEALAAHLSNALPTALYDAERKHAARLPEGTASALQLVLRAEALLEREASPNACLAARKLCEEALRHDSAFVPALVTISWAISRTLSDDEGADHEQLVSELDDVTSRVLQLDRNDPMVWTRRSIALAWQGQWERASEAMAEARRIDPYRNVTLGQQARLLTFMGRPEEALPILDRAIALDPRSPRVAFFLQFKSAAHLHLGQYDDAIAVCEKALALGDYWYRYLLLTAAYAQKGDMMKAAAAKAELLKRQPNVSIAWLKSFSVRRNPIYVQQSEATQLAGLRKAGIPEQ